MYSGDMREIASVGQLSEAQIQIAERYRGAEFHWEHWQSPNPDWDHDHCFSCNACICDSGDAGHYAQAYVTRQGADSPFWVCRSCFKLLRAVFEWTT